MSNLFVLAWVGGICWQFYLLTSPVSLAAWYFVQKVIHNKVSTNNGKIDIKKKIQKSIPQNKIGCCKKKIQKSIPQNKIGCYERKNPKYSFRT